VGKLKGMKPLGRPRRRWENGVRFVEWNRLAQDRDRWRAVVSAVLTERRAVVVKTPTSYSGGPGFKSWPRLTAMLSEVLVAFLIPPGEFRHNTSK
jgi:hypothetical protein